MTERVRSASTTSAYYRCPKMENDLSPRKTMLVLVIVVGCFAVLWPKVFYPMLVGSANQHIKPSPIDKTTDLRQERPHHLRSELVHPAFRERGRAIPQPHVAPPSRPPPRVVEGRPGPIPGMRPTIGGAGHVVPPSKQGTSSMSVIMPIYTIGIVIFFTYTLMRIIFKKQPEGVGGSLYPPVEPDPHFRKEVFESEASRLGPRYSRDISSKLGWAERDARDAELDQLRQRLRETELAMERIVEQMSKVPLKAQDLVNGTISNGDVVKPQQTEDQPTVKVLGMEMTASCEGGKKWSRPDSPVLPTSPPPPAEPVPPPQEIFLEGALPPQSHLLVADSATEPQPVSGEDPAVVLAGKMTLSVVSLDSENGGEEEISKPPEEPVIEKSAETEIQAAKSEDIIQKKGTYDFPEETIEEPEFEIEEYELHDLIVKKFDAPPPSKIQVEDLEKQNQEITQTAIISEPVIENIIQAPLIHLESEEASNTVEVEEVEKEVEELIQEAVQCIEQKQPIVEIMKRLQLETNDVSDDLKNEDEPTLEVVPQTAEQESLSESEPKQSEDKISDNECVIKDNTISEESKILLSNKQEESLKGIEEQLKQAAEEVAEVSSSDTDVVIEELVSTGGTAAILLPSSEKADIKSEEVKNKDEDVKGNIEIEMEKQVEVSEESKRDATKEEALEPIEISEKTKESQVNLPEASIRSEKLTEPVQEIVSKEERAAILLPSTEKGEEKVEIKSEDVKNKDEDVKEKIETEVEKQVEVSEDSKKDATKEEILEPVEISEKIEKTQVNFPEVSIQSEKSTEPTQKTTEAGQVKKVDTVEKTDDMPKVITEDKTEEKIKPDFETKVEKKEESKSDLHEEVLTDDEELGSDEELVEEIEEIVYEEESEEEEEGSEDEIERITNRTDSTSVQRINGERSEDMVEESKYTTASGNTAAENDISDEELTDDEEVEDEEEIIEVEEEIEEDDYAAEEGNDVNHISGESDPEL